MTKKSLFKRLSNFAKKLFTGATDEDIFEVSSNAKKTKKPTISNKIKSEPKTSSDDSNNIDTSRIETERLKSRLQPIIDEANKRWNTLDMLDLRSLAVSRAYDENDGKKGFDVSQLTDRGDIIAEATRARVFLQDRTSTVEGAELYTQQESYKEYLGQFGNQYNNWENKFKRFNISTISEDKARIAFAAYRRLEETDAARIMAYGSENMIAAIYDIVYKNNYSDPDNSDDLTDIAGQARDLLERELGEKRREFEKAFKESNSVTSILDIVQYEGEDIYGRDW